MPESRAAVGKEARIIRSTMRGDIPHPEDAFAIVWLKSVRRDDACDPAHAASSCESIGRNIRFDRAASQAPERMSATRTVSTFHVGPRRTCGAAKPVWALALGGVVLTEK